MCRNIRPLFNFKPPVTHEEIRAASLQFVRIGRGFNELSKVNEAALLAAVEQIAAISAKLFGALETNSPPKSREEETANVQIRYMQRFPG